MPRGRHSNGGPGQLKLPLGLKDQAGATLAPSAQRLLNLHVAWAEVVSTTGDLVELVAAGLISQPDAERLGTGPYWLLTVGPPASSKTEAVNAARGMVHTYYLDTLTENSFISGYLPNEGNPQDLLREIGGKCLIVKDLSPLLSLKEDVVKKVLGDLCAIYDGYFSKFTGTRGKVSYEAIFPFIACVTPQAMERHNRYISMIGPRFLYYRLPPLTHEQREEGHEIAWNSGDRKSKRENLATAMASVVAPLLDGPAVKVNINGDGHDYLNRLADLIAAGRASVSYTRVGSNYEPDSVQREEPWRALQQLQLVVTSLARIHGRDHVTAHEMEMARRLVLSTMPEARTTVVALFQRPDALVKGTKQYKRKRYSILGITCNGSAKALGKSPARAKQIIQELELLGLIQQAGKSKNGDIVYVPLPDFDDLLRQPLTPLDHPADLVGATTEAP